MKTKKLVFTSIFIALCFVATSIIKIPISVGWGYVHLGDAVVMLAGMLLGPIYGAVAAATGSALADYAGGYAVYMVPTFIVKGMLAFLVGYAYRDLKGRLKEGFSLRVVYHVIISIVVVVGGYFLSDLILAQLLIVDPEGSTAMAYAAFGLPWNTLQVVFGAVASLLLYYPLRTPFETYFVD